MKHFLRVFYIPIYIKTRNVCLIDKFTTGRREKRHVSHSNLKFSSADLWIWWRKCWREISKHFDGELREKLWLIDAKHFESFLAVDRSETLKFRYRFIISTWIYDYSSTDFFLGLLHCVAKFFCLFFILIFSTFITLIALWTMRFFL